MGNCMPPRWRTALLADSLSLKRAATAIPELTYSIFCDSSLFCWLPHLNSALFPCQQVGLKGTFGHWRTTILHKLYCNIDLNVSFYCKLNIVLPEVKKGLQEAFSICFLKLTNIKFDYNVFEDIFLKRLHGSLPFKQSDSAHYRGKPLQTANHDLLALWHRAEQNIRVVHSFCFSINTVEQFYYKMSNEAPLGPMCF